MADYIIQKAVNADAVKVANRRTMAEYAATFEAQPKLDGCCGVITLRGYAGPCFAQSRTGEACAALEPAVEYLNDLLTHEIARHGGLVLIGEAWSPGIPFNTLSGMFRRHKPDATLGFVVNDVLTYDEFTEGYSGVPYSARMCRLAGRLVLSPLYNVTRRYCPGYYGDPQALCNQLVEQGGHDGLILRDPKGTWTRGRGTTGEIVKVKQVLSYDLRVTAVYEGVGKHAGRMGAIGVDFGGKELRVGTGFSDLHRAVAWDTRLDARTTLIGQIAEIEAMGLSSEGLLREPRFKGIRHDKLEPDTL